MTSNIVHKCVDELLIGFHTLNIHNKGFSANKNLHVCLPTTRLQTSHVGGGCCSWVMCLETSQHLDTCNASDYLSDILFGSDDSNHIPKDYHIKLISALQGSKIEQVFFVLDLDVIIVED